MTENERKLYEVLVTLSSFPLNGFENMGFDSIDNDGVGRTSSAGARAIEKFASETCDFEEAVRRILNQTSNLQIQLFNCMLSELEKKKDSQIAELEKMKADFEKQKASSVRMTFTTSEIKQIIKDFQIKGKSSINTIISHLNNGTLKGKKQPNGTWVVKREDLEKYLGRKDF